MSDMRNIYNDETSRRHRRGNGGPWIGGVILIAVGAIFLLRNSGFPMPEHWWALFLLIPILGSLATAVRAYNSAGEMNGAVSGSLIGAGVLTALMLVFLLEVDINWQLLWPVILIAIGLAILARSYWRR